jgi:hypothetical protein
MPQKPIIMPRPEMILTVNSDTGEEPITGQSDSSSPSVFVIFKLPLENEALTGFLDGDKSQCHSVDFDGEAICNR